MIPDHLRDVFKSKLLRRRFLNKECWIWTGCVSTSGYGKVTYLDNSIVYPHRITEYVHRISMMIFKPEEFKEDLDILHTCDVKLCFNPDHLYCGTDADNHRDAMTRGQIKRTQFYGTRKNA